MDKELFKKDPRAFALDLIEQGLIGPQTLAHLLLCYMSNDDVRDALDANELSPRFDEDETEEN